MKPEFVLINNAKVIQIGSPSNQAAMKNFILWAADICQYVHFSGHQHIYLKSAFWAKSTFNGQFSGKKWGDLFLEHDITIIGSR